MSVLTCMIETNSNHTPILHYQSTSSEYPPNVNKLKS